MRRRLRLVMVPARLHRLRLAMVRRRLRLVMVPARLHLPTALRLLRLLRLVMVLHFPHLLLVLPVPDDNLFRPRTVFSVRGWIAFSGLFRCGWVQA
ncbi:hypothetical protein, partial [Rhodococcus sp. KRD162]|uniref:hypothetical protein n=1 Tax=Rhodococcus sp. KRD162 TaxID=2729725 RepID=UPI0019D11387